QKHPLLITKWAERNSDIKSLRAMRAILSFMSRTQYRSLIKAALLGSATDKYELLKTIDFKSIKDLGNKKADLVDFYKTVAFQMGQSYMLNYGVELYTKDSIGMYLPKLQPFLKRIVGTDLGILD